MLPGVPFVLPSQRRGLANSGLNLLNRLRLDGWERSVTLGVGFQNLDLKEQLRSRIDGPLTGITPLLGRYQPRRIQARAARRSGRAAQRLLVSRRAASRSRIRSYEVVDVLPYLLS